MSRNLAFLFVCLSASSVFVPVTTCQQLPKKFDLPLGFEENRGQAPAAYRYVFHRNGVWGEFSEKGVDFGVRGSARRVRMELVGGKLAAPVSSGLLPGKSNYFMGSDASRWVPSPSEDTVPGTTARKESS